MMWDRGLSRAVWHPGDKFWCRRRVAGSWHVAYIILYRFSVANSWNNRGRPREITGNEIDLPPQSDKPERTKTDMRVRYETLQYSQLMVTWEIQQEGPATQEAVCPKSLLVCPITVKG